MKDKRFALQTIAAPLREQGKS